MKMIVYFCSNYNTEYIVCVYIVCISWWKWSDLQIDATEKCLLQIKIIF
jgi:hypothetical protein